MGRVLEGKEEVMKARGPEREVLYETNHEEAPKNDQRLSGDHH